IIGRCLASKEGTVALNRNGCTLDQVAREHILDTLIWCNGNRAHAAKFLGVSIRCLRMKLHQMQRLQPDTAEQAPSSMVGSDGRQPGSAVMAPSISAARQVVGHHRQCEL